MHRMKLCRFQPLVFGGAKVTAAGAEVRPEPRAGVVRDAVVHEIAGSFYSTWHETGRAWPLAEVKLLPPCTPSKIVCVGRNYAEHAAELGNQVPQEPLIFLKPPSSIIAPEEPILLPSLSRRVDHEGELGVVIGKSCYMLPHGADTRPYVLGYTCVNDVTARDIQKADVQFTRGKGFDTFCPFGPVIETALDMQRSTVETLVNGKLRQHAPCAEMVFSVDAIIHWIAQVMTLEPGDLIATGTPSGIGPLAPGDVVEVIVSGIGTLRNPVATRE
jgi:2-keto-4-pentenoate hydratase/2-oxohepta-3-ene-1,7-dioic acid hydratase in catechol pathway